MKRTLDDLYGGNDTEKRNKRLNKELLSALENESYDKVGDILSMDGYDPYWYNDMLRLFGAIADKGNADILTKFIGKINQRFRDSEYFKDLMNYHLCDVVRKGNVEMARVSIQNGASTKPNNIYTEYILQYACRYGWIDMCKLLLDNGAEIDFMSRMGTPIYWATLFNRIDVVKLLLTYKANVNIICHGYSPLHVAKKFGYDEIVKLLELFDAKDINENVSLTVYESSNMCRIETYAGMDCENDVKVCPISNSGNYEELIFMFYNPIMQDFMKRLYEIDDSDKMLSDDQKVNWESNVKTIVDSLSTHGTEPTQQILFYRGGTVFLKILKNNRDIIKVLYGLKVKNVFSIIITYKQTVNNDPVQNPLYHACLFGHINKVKELLETSSNPSLKSDYYPMFAAWKQNHTDVIKLLGSKWNFWTPDHYHKDCSDYAYKNLNIEIIKMCMYHKN